MPTVYGSTIGSTWRSYLTYSIEETPTTYKVTVDDVGIDLTSTYVVGFSDHEHKGTLTVGSKSDYFTSSDEYTTDTSLDSYFTVNLCTFIIKKTASTQTVKVSFSLYFQDWIKWNKSMTDGTGYGASTSTASATLTVPALAKPTVSLTALRDSNVETTATFNAKVSSFSSDAISSVKLTVNGTTYSIGSGTVGSSGSLTFSKTITGLPINKISASLVATGEGGTSSTYTCYVPAAFYTLDIGNKGKEIAFGQSATTSESSIPSNGLFSCGMDADFQGNVSLSAEARTNLGLTDTGWVNLTTKKGTWNYCQYRYKNGIVYIRGYATAYAWSGSTGDVIVADGTIPSQYRPLADVDHVVRCGGARWGQIVVNPNGAIYVDRVLSGTTSYTSSSWIRFNVSYPI